MLGRCKVKMHFLQKSVRHREKSFFSRSSVDSVTKYELLTHPTQFRNPEGMG